MIRFQEMLSLSQTSTNGKWLRGVTSSKNLTKHFMRLLQANNTNILATLLSMTYESECSKFDDYAGFTDSTIKCKQLNYGQFKDVAWFSNFHQVK
jgi:hypothetical protein